MMFVFLTVVIVLVVVLFLLWPLFSNRSDIAEIQRDDINIQSAAARLIELKQERESGQITEEQFERYRLELETAALEDLKNAEDGNTQHKQGNIFLAAAIAMLVPLLSVTIYQVIGYQQALSVEFISQQNTPPSEEEIKQMILTAEEAIRNNPSDIQGRMMMGQVYMQLQRYDDAVKVYFELTELLPGDVDVKVNYAEALARQNNNRFEGEPEALLDSVLSDSPNHQRALWLAGFAKQQALDTETALRHWQRLLAIMEPGTPMYQQMQELIAELDSTAVVAGSSEENQTEQVVSIEVNVSLADQLNAELNPDSTLFIFARAHEGPPMPLAVHRGLAKDLPITVVLDDSMAMMPQMKLSKFPNVIIGARLSSNGQPQGQTGDFEGFSEIIQVAENAVVDVIIDSIKE